MGMHNKGTYMRVLTYAYTRIDIRVYAKYERIIRVCVVRIYLSCTVSVYPLQTTLRLFLGEEWSSPLHFHVSTMNYTNGLFLGEGWSSPLCIHVSAYPLQTTLRLFLGEGWSSPLRIYISTLLREAPLKSSGNVFCSYSKNSTSQDISTLN